MLDGDLSANKNDDEEEEEADLDLDLLIVVEDDATFTAVEFLCEEVDDIILILLFVLLLLLLSLIPIAERIASSFSKSSTFCSSSSMSLIPYDKDCWLVVVVVVEDPKVVSSPSASFKYASVTSTLLFCGLRPTAVAEEVVCCDREGEEGLELKEELVTTPVEEEDEEESPKRVTEATALAVEIVSFINFHPTLIRNSRASGKHESSPIVSDTESSSLAMRSKSFCRSTCDEGRYFLKIESFFFSLFMRRVCS